VAKAVFAPVMATQHSGVTLQIDVGQEVFDAKYSSLHPLFNKA
jgi:5-carboxymethyl-2-hydroxymuconate isomerase